MKNSRCDSIRETLSMFSSKESKIQFTYKAGPLTPLNKTIGRGETLQVLLPSDSPLFYRPLSFWAEAPIENKVL